ncbi:MAG: aminoacetone oxidase family FAD-binding enzyme [Ruminococcus sp.]|nr:aminoacetone oxidase family FAD-binding enzyme [Ruminococcus sp.]
MQQYYADIAIIGGGASGLAAAIEAKQCGGSDCRIVVLEKNARLGKKILATGNGRCNLGNIEEKQISHYTGSCTVLAEALFQEYQGSEAFFRSLGVICKADSGRLYPYSNHAASVLDALRLQLQDLAVDVRTDCAITALKRSVENMWVIRTAEKHSIYAKYVIAACGGYAAPAMGTDGGFFEILRSLGHTITSVSPALCPIRTMPSLLSGLKGIRVLAKASLLDAKGTLICSDSGEVQLTEQALSGICIFNLAAFVREEGMQIQLDLLEHLTEYEVMELLWNLYAQRSQWNIEDMLSGIFQKKMCPALFRASGIRASMSDPVYTLSPYEIENLSHTIKAWNFPVKPPHTWSTAQVTAGGIPAHEISETLESLCWPNLFLAGEMLDLAGACGGYNLAWAWCSGICAARSAVKKWKEDKGCDQAFQSVGSSS